MGKGVLLGAAGSFPADWYLEAFPSFTTLTEILRFAQYSGHMSSLFLKKFIVFS